MRLNISAWAIRQPIPSVVLFLVLTILGIVSFRALPITLFPNVDIPIVTITGGAGAMGANLTPFGPSPPGVSAAARALSRPEFHRLPRSGEGDSVTRRFLAVSWKWRSSAHAICRRTSSQ